jgi:hypothetical protein
MSRYKGRLSAKAMERRFPHIVEMVVPEGGFGSKINDMAAWHHERGIERHNGAGSYREDVWYVRWCFLNEADAEAFRQAFGGERLTSTGQVRRTDRR